MKIFKKILYLLLFGLIFFKYSISYLIITSFPRLGAQFSLNNFQLGLIISIFYLMSASSIFFWIYLFGKYSKLKVFLLGSFLWIFGTILFGLSNNYIHFLIFSALIGFGIESSAIFILVILLQMSLKKNQGKLMSIFIAIQGIGSLFGVFITAYFNDVLGLQWNIVYLSIGFLSLIWVLLSLFLLQYIDQIKEIITPYLDEIGYNLNFKMVKTIIKKKSNLHLLIILCYATPIIFFFNLWLQIYFIEFHQLSQMEAALSSIFLSGGEFLGMIFGGWLYDKYYSEIHYKKIYLSIIGISLSIPLFYLGFLLTWTRTPLNEGGIFDIAIDLLLFSTSNSFAFISYVMLFCGFFTFSFVYPLFLIQINDCNNGNEKSTMIGIRNLIEILGQAISPIIGGLIADSFSILIVMLMIPIFLIIPLFHLFILKSAIENDFLT